MAAALAACARGHRVVLVEEVDWLGGQLTAQAVPPDAHPWIEQFGCTSSYRRLRESIRKYYRLWYPLTERARAWHRLNPGAARVSGLCHEPRVAHAVLEGMLSPHVASGRLTVLKRHQLVSVDLDAYIVRAVEIAGPEGEQIVFSGRYFLDGTDNGDLLPLAGVEYAIGAESFGEHGEPHAPKTAQPGTFRDSRSASRCHTTKRRLHD